MGSPSGLREPQRWNDRNLLEDVPFKDIFQTRSLVFEQRGRNAALNWDKEVMEAVEKTPGWLEATQAWLDIAFYASKEEPLEIQTTKIKVDKHTLELFVKVFWEIFQNNDRAALILLNRERRKKGYVWDFVEVLREKRPPNARRTEPRQTAHSSDPVSEAGVNHENDVVIPGVYANADTSSGYQPSVFDEMSDEEKGDIIISSDTSMVVSPILRPMNVVEAAEGSASQPQDLGDENTRSTLPSGLRGQKRSATAEENPSSEHPSNMDEDIKSVDASNELRPPSSPVPFLSSRPKDVTVTPKSVAFSRSTAPGARSKAQTSKPSEPTASSRKVSAKPKQLTARGPRKSNNPTQRKKSRMIDDAPSDRDYVGTSTAPSNVPHRTTRSVSVKLLNQAGLSASTEPSNEDSRRQSTRLSTGNNDPGPTSNIRSASGRLRAPDKRASLRGGTNPKSATTVNTKASKSARPKRASGLPMRPPKRSRTEELRVAAMEDLTKVTASSQSTQEIQLQATGKDVAETSDKLAQIQEHNKNALSVVQTNKSCSEVGRSQASSESSTVITIALGKRKERTTDPQNEKPLLGPLTAAQSELQDMASRRVAKLPAGHNRRRSQHILPIPSQSVSIGHPLRDPELKIMDQVVRDAASHAQHLLQNPPKPLVDWTNGESTNDQDLDSLYGPHLHIDPSKEIVSSPEVVTIRDHEPDSRPKLTRKPPIWARSRQEVCESFDWFRSYQGGVYFVNDMVKGYLLSAFASSRDLFHHNGRLIISHGGGKSESLHSRDGRLETHMAEDQLAQDKSVRALLRNHMDGRPLVLLADDRYKLFPYNLAASDCTYVVLGFYHVTYAWAESHSAENERGRVVRYKFAFQWCESQGEPWWFKQSNMDTGSRDDIDAGRPLEAPESAIHSPTAIVPQSRSVPVKIAALVSADQTPTALDDIHSKCDHCRFQVPHVYEQGWMCLTPECPAFWTMKHGKPPGDALDYTANFLKLKPAQSLPANLPELFPKPPPTEAWDDVTTAYAFSKGWHCRQCGRLSSRYKWAHWECANCGCRVGTNGRLRRPNEFWTQLDQCSNHQLGYNSGILPPRSEAYDIGGARGEYIKYILPFNRGRIHLIRGNPRTNLQADDIFKQYQTQAASGELSFRRFPLRAHKCRGILLTNYFSQNSGEPYQYVGGTDNTIPFEEAGSAVLGALELIQTRAQAVLNQKPEFNEVLSAAYMERQRMAFHSDSEQGLGPIVASLSLGSAAVMHFRVHAHKRQGGEGTGNALTLTLRHGDVLVMEGAAVQKYYEHTVIPCNFRVAATARLIGGP